MPLLFIVPICVALLGYVIWKKVGLHTTTKKYFKLSVCTITWIGIVYQFVSIARYIDSSGVKIQNVMGQYGLYLSWVVLIAFSVYLVVVFLETFKKQ